MVRVITLKAQLYKKKLKTLFSHFTVVVSNPADSLGLNIVIMYIYEKNEMLHVKSKCNDDTFPTT